MLHLSGCKIKSDLFLLWPWTAGIRYLPCDQMGIHVAFCTYACIGCLLTSNSVDSSLKWRRMRGEMSTTVQIITSLRSVGKQQPKCSLSSCAYCRESVPFVFECLHCFYFILLFCWRRAFCIRRQIRGRWNMRYAKHDVLGFLHLTLLYSDIGSKVGQSVIATKAN